jgi:hypothetical protein
LDRDTVNGPGSALGLVSSSPQRSAPECSASARRLISRRSPHRCLCGTLDQNTHYQPPRRQSTTATSGSVQSGSFKCAADRAGLSFPLPPLLPTHLSPVTVTTARDENHTSTSSVCTVNGKQAPACAPPHPRVAFTSTPTPPPPQHHGDHVRPPIPTAAARLLDALRLPPPAHHAANVARTWRP